MKELNQSLIQRDKIKEDAITQLSGHLIGLTSRLPELERKSVKPDRIEFDDPVVQILQLVVMS